MITRQFDHQSAIARHLELLGHEGYGVTELRAFDPIPLVVYVDNIADAIRLAREKDEQTSGIYIGVQPRNLDLFDLAPNCWKPAMVYPNSNCASDKDIEYITAIFFDIDVDSPARKAGYPASDEELEKSLEAAQLLARQDGLALSGVICCSGNGHYVLAPIVPIAVDSEEITPQFKRLCELCAERVSRQVQGVKLDPVYNLSRVMRLMGTWNRKGEPLPSRPHRRAHFITEPMPAASMALNEIIRNTEVPFVKHSSEILAQVIKCDLKKIEDCHFIKWCREQPLEVTEPQWFALIINLARLEGGPELIHKISALDGSRYEKEQTHKVILRVLRQGYAPVSCDRLKELGFLCPKLGNCNARAPMYMATCAVHYTL